MSFRQFGGIQYASKHNIVGSNYNTSNNLLVTQNLGQPYSFINFDSDISGNIHIKGDFDLSGNLNVEGNIDCTGNLNVVEDIDLSGNLNVDRNINLSENLNVKGNIDCSSNIYCSENIDCSKNITAEYMFLSSGTNYSHADNALMPKSYIDSLTSGFVPSGSVKCVLAFDVVSDPANIHPFTSYTLPITIDTYSVQPGDYVLFNNQGTIQTQHSVNNGAYYLRSVGGGYYEFYRDTESSILPIGYDAANAFIKVSFGDIYENSGWLQTYRPKVNMIVGTDPIIFTDIIKFNVKSGQGINFTETTNSTYINVDPSLNFLTLIDASSSNPTLQIGTENADTILVGKSHNSTTFIKGHTLLTTLSTSSNVGIGKSITSNELDVSGNVAISGNLTINTNKFNIASSSGNTDIAGTLNVGGILSISNAAILYNTLSVANSTILYSTLSVSNATTLSSSLNVYGTTSLNGNVGIGKSSTSNALDVNGNIYIGGTSSLNGNVGIGKSSTSNALDVNGNIVISGTSRLNGNIGIGKSSTTSNALDVSGNMNIGGSSRLNGNVGIGGPSSLTNVLDVSGNIYIGGTSRLNGNVGIGKSSTSNALDISGNACIFGNLDVYGNISSPQTTQFVYTHIISDTDPVYHDFSINNIGSSNYVVFTSFYYGLSNNTGGSTYDEFGGNIKNVMISNITSSGFRLNFTISTGDYINIYVICMCVFNSALNYPKSYTE
jgi:cytoskeletal protein CcmA (bactofilin family)